MPEDGDAFRRTFAALDDDAREHLDRPFNEAGWDEQTALVQRVQDLSQAEAKWHGLPAKHVWSLWTRYACAAFYSHPWAWNEIGFGGPAYPRGYKNIGIESREPWEVKDRVNQEPIEVGAIVDDARRELARSLRVE